MNDKQKAYLEIDNFEDSKWLDEAKFFQRIFKLNKYSAQDMREEWLSGKELGFEMGLYYASQNKEE